MTASNSGAGTINGKIVLRTLPVGTYVATDLFSNTSVRFNVTSSGGTLPITVSRWDTCVLAITAG